MPATEPPRHVLVFVTAEFLESEGMLHILQETGAIAGHQEDWEKIVEAAENSGGFALAAGDPRYHLVLAQALDSCAHFCIIYAAVYNSACSGTRTLAHHWTAILKCDE